ncbi:unnamed protein product [Parnassius apollo]|uniref:(apollo) hypothetical protein n=1 Tax=Parnassius apollo TaxID=110799 RepID=A0A8S3XTF5_PARAO|nr:unnamed protein product [Parnassius apollo]
MTFSEYSQLKQQIVITAGHNDKHSQILRALKEYYKDEIDSPRRYEQINTIGQLIRILEIRDVLSQDNVAALKVVASRLPNNSELLCKISDYESSQIPRGYINQYDIDRQQNISIKEQKEILNDHACGLISPKKKERINETIVEEIGTFWRDLARNLKIRECVIDEIDDNNKKLCDKASKLLTIYQKRADPQRWFFVLCDALEKSRRKDISRSLQEIMSMRI